MNRGSGYILLNKPAGLTSFSVIQRLKRVLGFNGKIGHAGTLDSFATGLLICLTGSYTALSNYFMASEKRYIARFCFGKETDTLDPTGDVIRTAELPTRSAIDQVLGNFIGTINQIPPLYSAVHIDGKRAWERARNNETVNITPRSITIFDLSLINWEPPFADFSIHCSKGTYIRSLARDIAAAAGSCAHVACLERVSIGAFDLSDAVSLDVADSTALRTLSPSAVSELGMQPVTLSDDSAQAVLNGKDLAKIPELMSCRQEGAYAAFLESGILCAILRKQGRKLSYERVLQVSL